MTVSARATLLHASFDTREEPREKAKRRHKRSNRPPKRAAHLAARKLVCWGVAVMVFVSFLPQATAQYSIWGSSSTGGAMGQFHPGNLAGGIFLLDHSTAAASLVGIAGVTNDEGTMTISGLAFHPETGDLYGVVGGSGFDNPGAELIMIDKETGVGTPIGAIRGSGFDPSDQDPPKGCGSLAFMPDGTLYAGCWAGINVVNPGKLVRVDPATGEALEVLTTIGVTVDDGVLPTGLAVDPSGTMWMSRGGHIDETDPARLHRINPATGVVTSDLLLSETAANVSALAFAPDGTLYASLPRDSMLATIDTSTGAITRIGSYNGSSSSALTAEGGTSSLVAPFAVGRIAGLAILPGEEPELNPVISENLVLNTASGALAGEAGHAPAPGTIVSVFGFRFAADLAVPPPDPLASAAVPLETVLGGAMLTFDGVPAPMFAIFRGIDFDPPKNFDQINAQFPWGVDTSSGTVEVELVRGDDARSGAMEIQAADVSPGIFAFSGQGTGPAIVQNFSLGNDDVIPDSFAQPNGFSPGLTGQPAAVGGVIIIWATGLGPVARDVASGDAPGETLFTEKPVKVLIGGVEAQVIESAVLHPTLVGVNQVNAFVPDVEPGDAISIQLMVDDVMSRDDVTIAVRAAP